MVNVFSVKLRNEVPRLKLVVVKLPISCIKINIYQFQLN